MGLFSSRSSNSSTSQVTNTNEQVSFGDVDGLATVEGDIFNTDGGAIRANAEIAFDALNTARTGFTTAFDTLDDITESFTDAIVSSRAAQTQEIQTLVSATRSDAGEALSTVSKTVGLGVFALAGIVLFFTLRRAS